MNIPNFILNERLNKYGIAVLMFVELETEDILNIITKIELN